MGYSVSQIRNIRGESIGAEAKLKLERNKDVIDEVLADLKVISKLSNRHVGMLRRYILDLHESLREVSRVLVHGGEAVYVIGDSTLKGTFIRNSRIVEHVGRLNGLKRTARVTRAIPPNKRYMPPPGANQAGAQMEGRMRKEVVLSLAKL
jgi:hypothetical protein